MRRCVAWPFEILLLICAVGCSGDMHGELSAMSSDQADSIGFSEKEYILQRMDRLDIKLYYNPELNEQVTIRPDGKISLQLIEEVDAAGITAARLDEILTERYSQRLRYSDVSVIVRDFASMKVYVGGEINSPGAISLEGRMSALQAIMQAGGYKNSAEIGSVVILRNNRTETPEFITVDLRADLESGTRHNDILLEPQDILFVPKTKIAKLGAFVEQYVDQLIPAAFSFGLVYNLNPEVKVR